MLGFLLGNICVSTYQPIILDLATGKHTLIPDISYVTHQQDTEGRIWLYGEESVKLYDIASGKTVTVASPQ